MCQPGVMTRYEQGRRGWPWVRSAAWSRFAGTLAILGLVVTFHQVVRGAVQQGEVRRQATAAHAEAVWRCRTLRGQGVRVDCLLRLNSVLPTVAARDLERRT